MTILYILIQTWLIGLIIFRFIRARQRRQVMTGLPIVYLEWYASGCSQATVFTETGGGRGCVKLIVTPDLLCVTSWFPFTLFSAVYDMEHVVSLTSITSITRWKDAIELSYDDEVGKSHALTLMPKDASAFLAAVCADGRIVPQQPDRKSPTGKRAKLLIGMLFSLFFIIFAQLARLKLQTALVLIVMLAISFGLNALSHRFLDPLGRRIFDAIKGAIRRLHARMRNRSSQPPT